MQGTLIFGEEFVKEEWLGPEGPGRRYVDFPTVDKLEILVDNKIYTYSTFDIKELLKNNQNILFRLESIEECKL